jgi:hypothetical protein
LSAAAGCPRVPGRRVARARLDLACERAGTAALQLQRGPVRRGPAPGSRRRRIRGRACARSCGGQHHVRRHGARRRPHGHDSNTRRLRGDAPPSRNHHGGRGRFGRRGCTGGHARVERDERVGGALRPPGHSRRFKRGRVPRSRELSATPRLGPRGRCGSRSGYRAGTLRSPGGRARRFCFRPNVNGSPGDGARA